MRRRTTTAWFQDYPESDDPLLFCFNSLLGATQLQVEKLYEARAAGKIGTYPSGPCVYFIQRETGPIKIGYSANVCARLASLRTSSAERLSLITTMVGDTEDERELHQFFRNCRLAGEWFSPNPLLWEVILASINTGDWPDWFSSQYDLSLICHPSITSVADHHCRMLLSCIDAANSDVDAVVLSNALEALAGIQRVFAEQIAAFKKDDDSQ